MSSLIQFHYVPFTGFDRVSDDASNARSRPSTFTSTSTDLGQRAVSKQQETFRPRLDLYASKDSDVVTATFELPGLTSQDITIDLHHNRLTVSGGSSASDEHKEAGYTVCERQYGKFSRTLQLPFGTKPEDIKAKMQNGLLTLTFQKATEQQPQRISVQQQASDFVLVEESS